MKRLLIVLFTGTVWFGHAAETVWLDTLDLSHMSQGWGKPQVNRSIREKPLSIGGRPFQRGVGTHANSTLWLDLGGGSERFQAFAGVDDAAGGPATVVFRVLADGRKIWDSGLMKPGQAAREINLDVRGVKLLLLQVSSGGDGISYDHANWAEARFLLKPGGPAPRTQAAPREDPIVLTPKPGLAPRINGPRVAGCRPGNPFIFRIPTTGQRPMVFTAENLPSTLRLDGSTGILTGEAPPRGEYVVLLRARNTHGEFSRSLKIVSGDKLALTPPMGWNHWYTHYDRITDRLMREAADVMVASGMADVGYQYVSIDDCWMNAPRHKDPMRVGPLRDAKGNLIPNKHFPDMKAMTDYIHAKGLKAGIYTSPGPLTCAGFAGTWQHEEQDAAQFAAWGFDFLKYDWCSYGQIAKTNPAPELEKLKQPYRRMGEILKRQPRDIVFNLCQYGMGKVWEWGEEVGGHCWRTAGDLGFELDRVFEVALANAAHRQWSRPGAWNDPDYIQIGRIGNARGMGEPMECPLSPNEQYAFMSLWCLMAAPLFFSGDMGRLDAFTVNVLCNAEVIEVDQDPLGESAAVIELGEDTFAMVKKLEDGGRALGLFNRGELPALVRVTWQQLGLTSTWEARDLWRQKDLGPVSDVYETEVPRRGVALLKLTPKRP